LKPPADGLDAAVAAGVIDAGQAERLRVFLAARDAPPNAPGALNPTDREDVRFVRGFHDVFMSVGLVVLLAGLRLAMSALLPPQALAAGMAAGAAIIWALAEVFARRQRLVLPSIVLAAAFSIYAAMAASLAFDGREFDDPLGTQAPWVIAAALAAAAAFRLRFRLPFSVLLIAACAIGLVLSLLGLHAEALLEQRWRELLLVFGLLVFATAMTYDLRDPERRTLAADNGFWLHLLAAPMIVHALLSFVVAEPANPTSSEAAVAVAILVALALVALVVDRRALLMSGLIYFGAAIGALITRAQFDSATIFALTLVILGGVVVALGAGWRPARRLALAPLPASLRAALPSSS